MWKFLFFVVIITSSSIASKLRSAKAHVRARIVGGKEVEPNSIPYQAAVFVDFSVLCAGALISTDYVVTAAHCVFEGELALVILGGHDQSSETEPGRKIISAREILIHEDFDEEIALNDIALLGLSESVIFDQYIQPIALPDFEDIDKGYEDEIATASGWGVYEDDLRASALLRAVELTVISWTECANFYNPEGYLQASSANICTSGYRRRATCSGDSGGPLVVDGVLIGITSWGSSLCENCRHSVFTKVGAHLDWIYDNAYLFPTTPAPTTL